MDRSCFFAATAKIVVLHFQQMSARHLAGNANGLIRLRIAFATVVGLVDPSHAQVDYP